MTTVTEERIRFSDVVRLKAKQRLFVDSVWQGIRTGDPEYILFGGAAGPGKSYGIRWGAVITAIRIYHEYGLSGVRQGIFCESYPTLRDRQIDKVRAEFPAWLGHMNEANHDFTLAEEFGGGVLSFRNLDEVGKYDSAEFAVLWVDELTKNDKATFHRLRTRKRWVGVPHSPFAGATNPKDRGLPWVRKLWIEKDFSGDEDMGLSHAPFLFIPALPSDNDSLPASYWDTLNSLPPSLRAALLEGNWYIFQGQAFPEFQRPLHVIPTAEVHPLWRRIAGHDWGYNSPGHHLWGAIDPEGGVIIYREYAFRNLDPQEIAQSILFHQGQERITTTWADPSIWAERRKADLTQEQLDRLLEDGRLVLSKADQYAKAGLHCQPANNQRIAGKQRIHTLLKPRLDGVPWLRIMENCPILIRTMQNIQLDPDRPEDVLTDYLPEDDMRDDAYDALRYLLMGVPAQATPEVGTESIAAKWGF